MRTIIHRAPELWRPQVTRHFHFAARLLGRRPAPGPPGGTPPARPWPPRCPGAGGPCSWGPWGHAHGAHGTHGACVNCTRSAPHSSAAWDEEIGPCQTRGGWGNRIHSRRLPSKKILYTNSHPNPLHKLKPQQIPLHEPVRVKDFFALPP